MKVVRIVNTAKIPKNASEGSAGYDLFACEDKIIYPGERMKVPLGIAFRVPYGTYGRLASRSGIVSRTGVAVEAGTIDRDYTGPVSLLLHHRGKDPYEIKTGHSIAQLILEKITHARVVEVEELPVTDRGSGGWGSTGI